MDVHRAALDLLAAWPGWPAFRTAADALGRPPVHLAGGALRDAVLGRPGRSKDVDLFVPVAHLDDLVARLAPAGRIAASPFGSPRWHPAGEDAAYADLIAIERFDNGVGPCATIEDALRQFDFTGNALAVEVFGGAFLDPVGGLRDARARILRAVRLDYPDEPFRPGADLSRIEILWLRLVHYAARERLAIEPTTRAWLAGHERCAAAAPAFERLFFPLHPDALAHLAHA